MHAKALYLAAYVLCVHGTRASVLRMYKEAAFIYVGRGMRHDSGHMKYCTDDSKTAAFPCRLFSILDAMI